jgi:hypothetical protein
MGLRDKEAPKGKALKYSKEEMDKWQLDDIYQKNISMKLEPNP